MDSLHAPWRTGGLLPAPPYIPYSVMFSPDIYDEVTYDRNRITIVSKDSHTTNTEFQAILSNNEDRIPTWPPHQPGV